MGKRGPRKGWKKEQQRKNNTKVVKDENGQVIDSLNDPLVNAKQDSSISFGMDDRESVYEKADAFNHGIAPEENQEVKEETEATKTTEEKSDAVTETTEEVKEETTEATTETVEEEVVEETTEAVTEKTEPETSTEKEEGTVATDYVPEQKPKEEEVKKSEEGVKTVPLAALHESREKGKEKDKTIEELKQKLAEKSNVQQTDETEGEYADPETVDLRKRLDVMEAKEKQRDKELIDTQHEINVNVCHKSLTDRGIDGFDTIGRYIVESKLREMYFEDAIHAQANDNQEGWEKIYLDALPALQAIGREQHKTKIFDKKKEAKREANLITTSGRKLSETEQPKKKLTPQEEIMKEVNENRIT